jgi:peptidyl-prolyl cis-trans isomerase D
MRSASKLIFVLMAISFVVGFLLLETSGILNSSAVTTSTAVAKVNGQEILYTQFQQAVSQEAEQARTQRGRSLNQDELRQLENRVYEEMVTNVLLEQEYERRHITATPDEIRSFATNQPPEAIMRSPELQTDGRFDPEKYRRYLNSPVARQSGLRLYLENYARNEIRRQKLFDQIATGTFNTDDRLWRAWQDQRDTAQVTFVALTPDRVADSTVTVSDAELKAYLDKHEKDLERAGRAVVSILEMPRVLSAADTVAAREKALQLRDEILKGAKFEDIAHSESSDTASGSQGGDLGRGVKGRFVAPFENAAYALKVGEISQPVKTDFGFHLIRVDSRKGDTLALHHILVPIQMRDEAATQLDRRADTLAKIGANKLQPAAFDSAAKALGLTVKRAVIVEGQPATVDGAYVPDVSAWAFRGVKPGETSDLIDAPGGYYLARLDSVEHGGVPSLETAKPELRARVLQEKKLDALVADAQVLAKAAASSSLESAAQAKGLTAVKSSPFTRVTEVQGLGRFNEAIGAAFTLPLGVVSAPIKTDENVVILRVDQRKLTDRTAFESQKDQQRSSLMDLLRRKRVQDFIVNLRASAKIDDNRKAIDAASRRSSSDV